MYSPEQVPGAILLRRSICSMQIWIVHVDIIVVANKKKKKPQNTRKEYPAGNTEWIQSDH